VSLLAKAETSAETRGLVGYDVEHGRGVYNVLAAHFRQVDPESSRWRLRMSARYSF
jgi:hypothetical protein